MWFRRDLRLVDNPALMAAAVLSDGVAPLYVLDERLIDGPSASDNRTWFLMESLRVLDERLRRMGNRLHIRAGRPEEAVPRFAAETNASLVTASRDYSPFGMRRDGRVKANLEGAGIEWRACAGVLAVEPEAMTLASGRAYEVFRPFYRRWSAVEGREVLDAPTPLPAAGTFETGDLPWPGIFQRTATTVLEPGEEAARHRLEQWAVDGRSRYEADRDRLDRPGTSRLSQDFHFGLLSAAEALGRCDRPGDEAFRAEIAWRDFYAHLLYHRPELLTRPLRPGLEGLRYAPAGSLFEAWKAGQTGYPVVDAAMRQLRQAGWMPNRARMIAASFLVKDLGIDWREGARYFMNHLVDGEPASNSGGWQWSASTGTDAQPFFRVFNPVLQGKKFDPEGDYVRTWIPELAGYPGDRIHDPWEASPSDQAAWGCVVGREYPAPIVEHAAAREAAIRRFRELKLPKEWATGA